MLFEKDQKRQLIRQNQELKRQLQKAKGLITSLYRQIDQLKLQMSKTQKDKMPKSPKTPKMNLEERFDNSSDEGEKDLETGINQNDNKNSSCSPKVRFKTDNFNLSSSIEKPGHLEMRKAYTKIILNSEEFVPRKSIQKLLKKSSERRKQQDSFDEISIKAASTRDIPIPMPVFRREISTVRSEKVLFKKTSNSRPIFQHFFVTGLGKEGPSIIYTYPPESGLEFNGYLALIYGQNYLRPPDLSPCNSRSKISPNTYLREPIQQQGYKRQCYVIPIMKTQGQSSQRDYLIICQSEEPIVQKTDRQSTTNFFTRCYCFLTQWKFFSQFRKLSSLMVDLLQTRKRNKNPQNESQLGAVIAEEFERSLSFLYQKSTDYNKTIDCCIGESGLRFSADVPPLESSFQLVDKYLSTRLNTTPAYLKMGEEDGIQTKLYGLLLTYVLAETKIVLYSASKFRVSQTVLQLLELIKPLSYVNPIIVGTLRDEHQTYLDAPMALILGLWAESRKSNKQKIQIFMNRKLNLAGLIQKAKLSITDGIVVNLDTGLVFGGGLNPELNSIAMKLNSLTLMNKNSRNMRDYYKFVERMLAGRGESEQARSIWTSLMVYIKKTQLYCYYLQNRED